MKTSDDSIQARVDLARRPGAFAAAWAEAWQRSGRSESPGAFEFVVTETHYRPFVRARISFEGRSPGLGRPRFFFAQLLPDLASAEARLAKAVAHKEPRRTFGPPVFIVPQWCAVVWEMPGGPKLRIVRSFMQHTAFRRALRGVGFEYELEPTIELPELLRYVPRKRAVFRWPIPGTEEVLFIKLYEPGGDRIAMENLRWLTERRGQLVFDVPSSRYHYPKRRAVFMQGLPGRVVTERYDRAGEPALALVGEALASLHGAGKELTRTWSAADELAALERAMIDVTAALPALEPRVTALVGRLADWLETLPETEPAPVHGNFFGDQVLVHGHTSAGPLGVGIVDWDDLALGDGEFDVGRLMAHIRFCGWQQRNDCSERLDAAVLAGYRGAGRSLCTERLTWYVAVCLMMRAKISALRKLSPEWARLVEQTLAEAERLSGLR